MKTTLVDRIIINDEEYNLSISIEEYTHVDKRSSFRLKSPNGYDSLEGSKRFYSLKEAIKKAESLMKSWVFEKIHFEK